MHLQATQHRLSGFYYLDSRMYTVDKLGDLLFGRALRLRLAGWILDRGERKFYQSEPITEVKGGISNIRDELARFVDLGMLVDVPPTPNDRRRYYRRTDSQLWDAIRVAVASCRESEAKTTGK